MNAMRRSLFAVGLAAVVAAGVGIYMIWGAQLPKPTSPGLQKVSLRLQWVHQAQFAGFYVAREKGFYREEGIDLTINPGGQDFNALTLVSSDSDTFGIWTADQVLLGFSKGAPVRALGAIFDRSLAGFMVRADSDIKSPKDFEGKTVGMYIGYDTETIYIHLLKRFGVDRSKIKETPLQYDLARFLIGQVDVWPAYVINQPLAAQRAGVQVRVLTPEQFGIPFYSDILITNSKTAEQNPELVKRFVRASERGWRYAIDHREEAVDIVLKMDSTLTRPQQSEMLDVVANYIGKRSPVFAMRKETWASISSLLVEQGLMTNSIKIDNLIGPQ